jgi:hypothetical protein
VKLKENAAFLLKKSVVLVTAAGIKKSFDIKGISTWNGERESIRAHRSTVVIRNRFKRFQRKEFDVINTTLKQLFPWLDNPQHPLFAEVTFFLMLDCKSYPYHRMWFCYQRWG